MDLILSGDPGKRNTGCALWDASTLALLFAWLSRNPLQHGGDDLEVCASMARRVNVDVGERIVRLNARGVFGVRVVRFAAERPQVYTASKQRKNGAWADPNDLPPLMGVDVGIAVLVNAPGVSYLPREWKGTLSKEAMNERALERLSPEERACIEDAGALTHNILDGIGVGLHHIGRGFVGRARRRVYAR